MRFRALVALSAALAALVLPTPARADALSIAVAARASQDVGTTFVTGTESGPGGGIGVRASFGDEYVRWEPELDIDVAGFEGEGEGDGDAIIQASFLVSRRAFFFYDDAGGRPWWSIGAGVGGVAGAGGGAAFPVRVALGVSLAADSTLGLEASVFNRFTLVSVGSNHGGGGYINSTGVEIAVRFGR